MTYVNYDIFNKNKLIKYKLSKENNESIETIIGNIAIIRIFK